MLALRKSGISAGLLFMSVATSGFNEPCHAADLAIQRIESLAGEWGSVARYPLGTNAGSKVVFQNNVCGRATVSMDLGYHPIESSYPGAVTVYSAMRNKTNVLLRSMTRSMLTDRALVTAGEFDPVHEEIIWRRLPMEEQVSGLHERWRFVGSNIIEKSWWSATNSSWLPYIHLLVRGETNVNSLLSIFREHEGSLSRVRGNGSRGATLNAEPAAGGAGVEDPGKQKSEIRDQRSEVR